MAGKAVVADLTWAGDLRFATTVGGVSFTLDSASTAGPSPVEALVSGLAGCMAIDLALILTRGRHPLTGLKAHIVAHRAEQDPKRIRNVELAFALTGAVPPEAVERAIALSRDKYCSVWHSLRQDIDLQVTFGIAP